MKKILQMCLLFLGLVPAVSSLAQEDTEAELFTLEEAISYATSNHTSVQKIKYDLEYSRAQLKEYTAVGIPKVTAKLDYNYFIHLPTSLIPASAFAPPGTPVDENEYIEAQFGTRNQLTADVTLSTLVFNTSYFIGLKASQSLIELTRKQGNITIQELKYNVRNAYLTVLIAAENKEILEKNIENLKKTLRETQDFYENGLVELLDVDRLKLSLANLEAELGVVNRQVELARNVLKFQMNYPLENPIELGDNLEKLMIIADEEDLDGKIPFGSRPELAVLKQSKYLNELNLKRYKMNYVPSLSAFISHQQTLQRNNLFDGKAPGFFPTTVLGFSLNIPIFDGLDSKAKVEMTEIDIKRINLQMTEFKNGMSSQVYNARTNYRNAQERFDNQKKSLDLAERILNTTKIKYNEGVGSSLELVQAERDLYTTQANYINALYDFVVAKTSLDQALGK